MNILQRYIVKTMILYTFAVMFILFSVYGFLNFINEIKHIGQANYTTFEALFYVVMDLPAVMYSHSSVVILLGTLLALSHLASTSQLVVLRASGISIMNITGIVIRTSLVFLLLAIFVGEFVAPSATQYAQNVRNTALGHASVAKSQQGFWLKDGRKIIKVEKNLSKNLLQNVTLINLDNPSQIGSIIYAEKAGFDGEYLYFDSGTHYILDHSQDSVGIQSKKHITHRTKISFNNEIVQDLKKKPDELSTWNLYQQMVFLSNNQLVNDALKVEFYKRLIKPFTLIAMILFSMLFVFGSLRDASLGKKIFLGLMLSLFFELSSRIGGILSIKLAHSHFLSASLPTLVILIVAYVLLKRKSLK